MTTEVSDTIAGYAQVLKSCIKSIGCERKKTTRRPDGTRWLDTMCIWPPPRDVLFDAARLWEWARERRPYLAIKQWDWCVERYDALVYHAQHHTPRSEPDALAAFNAATDEEARVVAALGFLAIPDSIFSRSRVRTVLQDFGDIPLREALKSLKGEKPESALKWLAARCRKASTELAKAKKRASA